VRHEPLPVALPHRSAPALRDASRPVPSGVVVSLEHLEHFEDVSDRKNQFAIVSPYGHHDLSGDVRHADTPGLKIVLSELVRQNNFAYYERLRQRAADLTDITILIENVTANLEVMDQSLPLSGLGSHEGKRLAFERLEGTAVQLLSSIKFEAHLPLYLRCFGRGDIGMGGTDQFLDTRDRYFDLASREPIFSVSAKGHRVADHSG
jgi:hypothetical protein